MYVGGASRNEIQRRAVKQCITPVRKVRGDYHGVVRGTKVSMKLVTALGGHEGSFEARKGHRHSKLQRGLIDEKLNAWETLMQYTSPRARE